MPEEILAQTTFNSVLEEQKTAEESGNMELSNTLSELLDKVVHSSKSMDVLSGVVKALTSDGKPLHDVIGKVAQDFNFFNTMMEETAASAGGLSVKFHELSSGVDTTSQSFKSLNESAGRAIGNQGKPPQGIKINFSEGSNFQRFATGGIAIGGKHGTDSVKAMLTPGEVVLNKRQQEVLASRFGVKSGQDIFKLAGGNACQKATVKDGFAHFASGTGSVPTMYKDTQQGKEAGYSIENLTDAIKEFRKSGSSEVKSALGKALGGITNLTKLMENVSSGAKVGRANLSTYIDKIYNALDNANKNGGITKKDADKLVRDIDKAIQGIGKSGVKDTPDQAGKTQTQKLRDTQLPEGEKLADEFDNIIKIIASGAPVTENVIKDFSQLSDKIQNFMKSLTSIETVEKAKAEAIKVLQDKINAGDNSQEIKDLLNEVNKVNPDDPNIDVRDRNVKALEKVKQEYGPETPLTDLEKATSNSNEKKLKSEVEKILQDKINAGDNSAETADLLKLTQNFDPNNSNKDVRDRNVKALEKVKQEYGPETPLTDLEKATSNSNEKKLKSEVEKILQDKINAGDNSSQVLLDSIKKIDFSRMNEGDVKKTADTLEGIKKHFSPKKMSDTEKEFMNAKQKELEGDDKYELMKYSQGSQEVAEPMIKLSHYAQNDSASEDMKKAAAKGTELGKNYIELRERDGLTRSEKAKVAGKEAEVKTAETELLSALKSGDTKAIEDAKKKVEDLAREIENLSDKTKDMNREISVSDGMFRKFDDAVKNAQDEMNKMFGGNVSGWMAVGAGIIYATSKLSEFINKQLDTINNLAKLSMASAVVATSMNSMGAGNFEEMRSSLNLTRNEMVEFAGAMKNSFREANVSMEQTSAVAQNLVDKFGRLDPKMLNETLAVMGTLAEGDIKALSGGGTESDVKNLHANASFNGNAGQIADALESGAFGEVEGVAGLSEGDKAIVENMQEMKKLEEDIKVSLKDGFGLIEKIFPASQVATAFKLGAVVPGQLFWIGGTVKAILAKSLGKEVTSIFGKSLGDLASKFKSGFSSLSSSLSGLGASMGPAVGLAVAGAIVYVLSSIIKYFADKASKKEEARKNDENKMLDDVYAQTGVMGAGTYDAKETRNAKMGEGAASKALIYGAIGAAMGAIIPGVGNLVGAAVGAITGVLVGTLHGMWNGLKDFWSDSDENTFKTVDGETNTEMVETLGAVRKNVAIIHGIQMKNRSTMIKSLRAQENTQAFLKGLKSGKDTRFEQQQIESSKQSIEMLGVQGGSDAMFGVETQNIIDNSSEAFEKKTKLITDKRQTNLDSDISPEVKAQNERDLMMAQADVVKEFVNSVLSSVGEYKKIPSIIQNELKKEITSMQMDLDAENFAGTSSSYQAKNSENLNRTVENVGTTVEQYKKDQANVQKAKETLDKQNESAKKMAQEKSGALKDLGVGELFDSNGEVNYDNVQEGKKKLLEERKKYDKDVYAAAGLDDHKAGVLAGGQATIDTLRSQNKKLAEIDKDDVKLKSESFQKQEVEALLKSTDEAILYNESIQNDSSFTQKQRDAAKKAAEGLKKEKAAIQDKFYDDGKFKAEDGDDFKKIMTRHSEAVGASAGAVNSEFEAKKAKAEDSDAFKKRKENLSNAEMALNMAGNVRDSKSAIANMQNKMDKAMLEQAKNLSAEAGKAVSSINSNPMVKYYDAVKQNILDTQDWMMATGDVAGYVAKSIAASSNRASALKEAAVAAKQEFNKAFEEYNKTIAELGGDGLSADAKAAMEEIKKLEQLKVDAAGGDPEAAAKLNEQQKVVDKAMTAKGISSEEKEKISKFQTVNAAMLGAKVKMEGAEGKAKGAQFAAFKDSLNLIDAHKGSLDYMAGSSKYEAAKTKMQFAEGSLDPKKVAAASAEALSGAKEMLGKSREGVETWRDSQMKALDTQLANASSPEEREAIMKEKEVVAAKADDALAKAELDYKNQVVEATKKELQIKQTMLDLARQELDIEADLAQAVGAPAETILAIEKKKVDNAKQQAKADQEAYEKLVKTRDDMKAEGKDVSSMDKDIEEARLKANKSGAESYKAEIGAQRSFVEKMFGQAIGSFGSVAGIMGPGNAASQFGYGYMLGPDGAVTGPGDEEDGGYQGRLLNNNANGSDAEGAKRMGPSGQLDFSGQGSIQGSNRKEETKLGTPEDKSVKNKEAAKEIEKAKKEANSTGGSTKGRSDYGKLGEKIGSETEGLEMVVYWEKKIYELLNMYFDSTGAMGVKTQDAGRSSLAEETYQGKAQEAEQRLAEFKETVQGKTQDKEEQLAEFKETVQGKTQEEDILDVNDFKSHVNGNNSIAENSVQSPDSEQTGIINLGNLASKAFASSGGGLQNFGLGLSNTGNFFNNETSSGEIDTYNLTARNAQVISEKKKEADSDSSTEGDAQDVNIVVDVRFTGDLKDMVECIVTNPTVAKKAGRVGLDVRV